MKQIPNLFTLLNLVFGCIAIVFVLQNGIAVHYADEGNQYLDLPQQVWYASLFIALAAVVDFLDGFVARAMNASSDMGKQLDSLADVVSFGVAPSMIVYEFLRLSFAKDTDSFRVSSYWPYLAFVLAAAAAYRLAKFNLDKRQQLTFIGLPTPAMGLLVASFPLIYWNTRSADVAGLFTNKWFLVIVVVLLSWLMVSEIPMLSLKFKDYRCRSNMPKIILLAAALLSAFFVGWAAVPVVFIVYIILSLVYKNTLLHV